MMSGSSSPAPQTPLSGQHHSLSSAVVLLPVLQEAPKLVLSKRRVAYACRILCLILMISLRLRVWDVNTGEVLNTLIHHNEAVLHLRFCNGLMVTCSKDRSIAVWDMASPTDISLRRVLVGHRAAVNVVDFDDKYIVSASGDRTIKASLPRTLRVSSLEPQACHHLNKHMF